MHSPFHLSFSRTSSSQCCFQPPFSFCSFGNASARRKNITIMACVQQENQIDSNSCARRVVLFMGFAAIRALKTRAEAIDVPSAEHCAPDQEQNAKLSVQGNSSQNPFFSLLNALGVLGSGVLAALFASTNKEKAASDAIIESMNVKLKEKEDAIASLEKKFEEELLNEKEVRNKALANVNAQKQSLVNQLKLANDTITSLGEESQKERRLVEELTIQVDDLEGIAHDADGEKRQLQKQLKEKLDSVAVLQERMNLLSSDIKDKEDNSRHLNSKLADKEKEFDQLTSVYHLAECQITSLKSEIKQLKDVLLKNEEEMDLKNEMVHKLNAELNLSLAEKDDTRKKLDAILEEYNHFKSSIETKSASNAKLLGEKDENIHLLEEQLQISLDEANKVKVLISHLTLEKENLKETLNIESKNVQNLEQELKVTQDDLNKSKEEASDLAKQLQHSRRLCSELEAEVGKVQSEFSEARVSLERNIDEAKRGVEVLAGELRSAKELLSKSNEELQIMSQELASAVQKCDSLEREVVDAVRKAESALVELNEEKKITSSLNKELKNLETQISKDKEARKSLESDLEVATKSLNEMNRNALVLSRELDFSNSRVSNLEDEREALYNSINVQKQASQEARKNLEDAHNLVMRLGKEREILMRRGKKLEEELASAKGEILRLSSQISSSRTPVNNIQSEQKVDVGGKAAATRRKVNRRRKFAPQRTDS